MDTSDPRAAALLRTAPLLAGLHRRRPDVDLVVLPPVRPSVRPSGRPSGRPLELSDDEALRRLARLGAQLTQLWRAATGDACQPVGRWHYAAEPGSVRPSSRARAERTDGHHVLAGLRAQLEERGWEVARPPGRVPRLSGRIDELELAASFAEGSATVLVSLAGSPLVVGSDRARSLVRLRGDS